MMPFAPYYLSGLHFRFFLGDFVPAFYWAFVPVFYMLKIDIVSDVV